MHVFRLRIYNALLAHLRSLSGRCDPEHWLRRCFVGCGLTPCGWRVAVVVMKAFMNSIVVGYRALQAASCVLWPDSPCRAIFTGIRWVVSRLYYRLRLVLATPLWRYWATNQPHITTLCVFSFELTAEPRVYDNNLLWVQREDFFCSDLNFWAKLPLKAASRCGCSGATSKGGYL